MAPQPVTVTDELLHDVHGAIERLRGVMVEVRDELRASHRGTAHEESVTVTEPARRPRAKRT